MYRPFRVNLRWPPMFNVEINPTNCVGGIYEGSYLNEDGDLTSGSEDLGLDNSMSDEMSIDDYNSWSKEKKNSLYRCQGRRISRILRSFEYLWANGASKGLKDTFHINKFITEIGQKMKMANEEIEKRNIPYSLSNGTGAKRVRRFHD